jgi:hypothetical protein
MTNYEAAQDGGNYLAKEVDLASIAAHWQKGNPTHESRAG